MTQVVLELDVVEEQVLKKLVDLGLFNDPQEAFKVALLKYALDLGDLGDMKETIEPRVVKNLDRLALTAAPEEVEKEKENGSG